jgi:acyl carrier protein
MDTDSGVATKVRQLVSDVLGVPFDSVQRESSYLNVEGWDSFNIVRLVMAAEVEFRVSISPDDALRFTSVEEIISFLESKGVVVR